MDTQTPALLIEVLETLADPVILIDGRQVVTLANHAARDSWPGLVTGAPLSFTLRAPDLIGAIGDVLSGQNDRSTGSLEERLPVERHYEFSVSALRSADRSSPRTAPAAALVFRDLTESKRLESMRVDFVANASHELRTPLASLLGFIETLQGPARNDPTAQTRFLAIMRDQAKRMSRLIDDLLSLSRVELSAHRRPVTMVDLGQVTRQVCDALRPLAVERQVTITCSGCESPIPVTGDRDELLRIAENLIENAIKYGQSGGRIDVRVSDMSPDVKAGEALLSVRDYGPGIAAEHLPRLTERFYRVDASASRETGGTGLGLAIVKHIVNRHRGRLKISSHLGEGSTFEVYLPAAGKMS